MITRIFLSESREDGLCPGSPCCSRAVILGPPPISQTRGRNSKNLRAAGPAFLRGWHLGFFLFLLLTHIFLMLQEKTQLSQKPLLTRHTQAMCFHRASPQTSIQCKLAWSHDRKLPGSQVPTGRIGRGMFGQGNFDLRVILAS